MKYVFIPQLGFIVIVLALLFYFGNYYMAHKAAPSFGSKIIWIPMLVIILSVAARIIVDPSLKTLAGVFFVIFMFAIYVAAREMGKDIFLAFVPFVVLVAVSCIINGIVHPGVPSGGIITNYAASAGFMIFGTVVNRFKLQWVLVTIALIALFFVGALEAVFVLAVLTIVLLIRRDYSVKLLLVAGVLLTLVTAWFFMGHLTQLYTGNNNLAALRNAIQNNSYLDTATADDITTDRWGVAVTAIDELSILGHGYEPNLPTWRTVHNVPLVIVDQVGPIAAVAWLVVVAYCLFRTRWKYAWITFILLGIWDHFTFTQFSPWMWVLAGVSTTSKLKSDLIFREGDR